MSTQRGDHTPDKMDECEESDKNGRKGEQDFLLLILKMRSAAVERLELRIGRQS